MPGHKGHAWGNALLGYKYQRRTKGGQFTKGKVQGFQTAMAKGKTKDQGSAKWKGAAIGAGSVLLAGAVVGGGIYAYKSGLHKKLGIGPTTGIKSADASVKASAKIAATSAVKNVTKSGLQGSGFAAVRKELENVSNLSVMGGKGLAAIATGNSGDTVFEKIQNASKTAAALSGSVVAVSGASAVAKAAVNNIVSSSKAEATPKPKAKRTPRAPKPAVVPQPGSKNVAAQASSKAVSSQVAKATEPKAKDAGVVNPIPTTSVKNEFVPNEAEIAKRNKSMERIAKENVVASPELEARLNANRGKSPTAAKEQRAARNAAAEVVAIAKETQAGTKVNNPAAVTPTTKRPEFVSKNTPEFEAKLKARIINDTPEAALERARKRNRGK